MGLNTYTYVCVGLRYTYNHTHAQSPKNSFVLPLSRTVLISVKRMLLLYLYYSQSLWPPGEERMAGQTELIFLWPFPTIEMIFNIFTSDHLLTKRQSVTVVRKTLIGCSKTFKSSEENN